uniref:Uncharacterized protein n=1 Tax=Anopheles maculatus TaxID=74869 RepID=A0A182SV31_9DIPT
MKILPRRLRARVEDIKTNTTTVSQSVRNTLQDKKVPGSHTNTPDCEAYQSVQSGNAAFGYKTSTSKTFIPETRTSPKFYLEQCPEPKTPPNGMRMFGKLVLTLHVIFVNNSNLVRSDFVNASDKVVALMVTARTRGNSRSTNAPPKPMNTDK